MTFLFVFEEPSSSIYLHSASMKGKCNAHILKSCVSNFEFHFADVFSYDEDDMVEDPNLAQHLAHFGINITQMEKVCDKLCIGTNSQRINSSKQHLVFKSFPHCFGKS